MRSAVAGWPGAGPGGRPPGPGERPAPHAAERRSGLALLAVVVALLGCVLLAHGAWLLAREERAAATAAAALTAVGARARGEVTRLATALDLPPGTGLWEVVPLERSGGPEGWTRAGATRLSREWWWVEATAGVPGGPGAGRAGAVAWVLDPGERVAAVPAVVETAADGFVRGADRVASAGWRGPPNGLSRRSCAPYLAARDSAGRPNPVAVARRPVGAPPALGLLDLDGLAAAAEATVSGTWRPVPERRGARCVDGEGNWGDPDNPTGPCGDRFVLRVAPGDLQLTGGTGQGILAASGDLDLEGDARFAGVVVVRGRLRLRDAARISGVVVGGVEIDVGPRAGIVGSACAAGRALAGVPAAVSLVVVPRTPRWIGPLPPTVPP